MPTPKASRVQRILALTSLLTLLSIAGAQTKPCLAEFDSNNRVSTLIYPCSLTKPMQFAYKTTVAQLLVVQAMQVCTGHRSKTGTMAVEVFTHDAINNRPGGSLAQGIWQVTGKAPNSFQGANLNKVLLMVPATTYWFVWTTPCAGTAPHEGYSAAGKIHMTRVVGGNWRLLRNRVNLKYRLFCSLLDQAGVKPVGLGCGNSGGSFFSNQVPAVGNPYFKFEGTNLPPGARTLFFVGIQKTFNSINLTAIGAPGCFLHTDMVLSVPGTTGTAAPGTGPIGRGHIVYDAAIPNNPVLKGAYLRGQLAVVDATSTNPLKAVFTNGLAITIQ